MFLKQLRNFFIKSKIKKKLLDVVPDYKINSIKKIGIIVDETSFKISEALVNELIISGFDKDNITVLIFKDKIFTNDQLIFSAFSDRDLQWSGRINNNQVASFIDRKFDLLINYYDYEKLPLLVVTNDSKAFFKVGFAAVDKRINHFIVNTTCENYKVFVAELLKYLKILKKL